MKTSLSQLRKLPTSTPSVEDFGIHSAKNKRKQEGSNLVEPPTKRATSSSQWGLDTSMFDQTAGGSTTKATPQSSSSATAVLQGLRRFHREAKIHDIVRSYDIEKIRHELKQNKSLIHLANKDGETPLHVAARRGAVLVAEALSEFKPDFFANNKEGYTPAYLAAVYGHPITAEFLYDQQIAEQGSYEDSWYTHSAVLNEISGFVSAHKSPSQDDISNLVAELTGVDVEELNNPEDVIKNATHLQGLGGKILGIKAEGWCSQFFFPQRIRALVTALVTGAHREVVASSGLSEDTITDLFLNEIVAELDALRTARRNAVLAITKNDVLTQKATRLEARSVVKRAMEQSKGEECFLALGFPGHALYLSLAHTDAEYERKEGSLTCPVITLRVDNLGAGYFQAHQREEEDKVQSRSFNVPMSFLRQEQGKELLVSFVQDVLECDASPNTNAEDLYRCAAKFKQGLKKSLPVELVESRSMMRDDDAEAPQRVGNCTVENTFRGLKYRLESRELYDWFRDFETKLSNSLVQDYADPAALLRNARKKRDTQVLHALLESQPKDLAGKLKEFFAEPSEAAHRSRLGESILPEHVEALIKSNEVESVQELLVHGMKEDLQGVNDETPLHWAAKAGRLNITQTLITAGAALDDPDKFGDTPLMWAVKAGQGDIASVLELMGANPERANKAGLTPRMVATQRLFAAQEVFDAVDAAKGRSIVRSNSAEF